MTNTRCIDCVNYLGGRMCLAFNEIPKEIMLGENDHAQPLPGQDNDFVFEPK